MQKRIAMIGGGNMAGALVAGLVAAGYPSHLIDVMDRNQTKCDRLHTEYAVNTHLTAGDWLKQAEVVVLAVKPQGLFDTIGEIKTFLSAQALYISIAAGVRIEDMARWLGSDRVVRAMPAPAIAILLMALTELEKTVARNVRGSMMWPSVTNNRSSAMPPL